MICMAGEWEGGAALRPGQACAGLGANPAHPPRCCARWIAAAVQ